MVVSQEIMSLLQRYRDVRPRTRAQLAAYVRAFLGLRIPSQRLCEDHDSPLDYLAYVLLGDGREERPAAAQLVGDNSGQEADCHDDEGGDPGDRCDIAVWANRGGGKTQLGAVASLLECHFLSHCRLCILGGSADQSQRMYEYLRDGIERSFEDRVDGRILQRGCRFVNGSDVQVLAQSDRSVRGHHVQRLRCDEVELFDPNVWQAAQFVTQARAGIPSRLEVLSTMHRPFGLMHEVLSQAGGKGIRVFKWCLWEVIERCRDRQCSRCVLWEDCRGRAKTADGYFEIDDAIRQKRRSSEYAWRAEMLCHEPNREDVVFSEFTPAVHVRPVSYNPDQPLYRSIDFGFRNPLVCLFLQVDPAGTVIVLDEHVKTHTTLAEHARLICRQYPYPVAATYCDPAGRQQNEITGTNAVAELAACGIPVRSRPSRILDGITMIRNLLAPAVGPSRLIISPRCTTLIRSLRMLRYQKASNGQTSELPEKDGIHDHAVDALRYFLVNRFGPRHEVLETRY